LTYAVLVHAGQTRKGTVRTEHRNEFVAQCQGDGGPLNASRFLATFR
jgi:hypothetical protein